MSQDEERLSELIYLHEGYICECSEDSECDWAFLFRLIIEARKKGFVDIPQKKSSRDEDEGISLEDY